ncbi:MAG: ABC transporter ATP-binding protein [Chloroflexota bacterium]|nr:ABC transporter ATP-binding protein [Chloroflexota bacterium]
MTPLLEIRQASKMYGGSVIGKRDATVALDHLSYSIPDSHASMTAIAGESGSGKTTLALLMMGFLKPTSGQVFYRGKDVAGMSAAERRLFRREVQPIFQDPYEAFNPFYRVDHVLETPLKRFGLASSKQEARGQIEAALEKVGLRPNETLGRFPHQLSGGQRQRIGVARALLCRPRVIVADEPVSMVDASLRATILASLQVLNRDFGISIIYITHDLTTAYQICENIVILYLGKVVEVGTVERVIRAPKHPYTQLLVSSIPVADRRRRWGDDAQSEAEGTPHAIAGQTGCPFAPRCPSVMQRCWQSPPPLFLTDPHRAAACFLHTDATVLSTADVASVFPTTPDLVRT